MKKTTLIFLTILISSCGNNTEPPRNTDDSKKEAVPYCYAWISGKDSVLMQLKVIGEQVQGELSYYYFEKDKSRGTIQGSMHGDTLFATYTFFAEGTKSIREVAFLKKGTDFVEGYGDVSERGEKMVFNNPNSLDFNHSVLLKSRDCK